MNGRGRGGGGGGGGNGYYEFYPETEVLKRILVVRLCEEETGCDSSQLCLCMCFVRFTGLICEESLGWISEVTENEA